VRCTVHQYQQSFEHSSNADFNRPVEYLYIVLPAVRGNTISDPRPHRQRPRTALPTSEKRQRERSRGCGFCAASHMSRMMLWCPPGEFQCLARACYAQYFCEFANAMLPYRSLSKDDCTCDGRKHQRTTRVVVTRGGRSVDKWMPCHFPPAWPIAPVDSSRHYLWDANFPSFSMTIYYSASYHSITDKIAR
jgi:hypothetical protein